MATSNPAEADAYVVRVRVRPTDDISGNGHLRYIGDDGDAVVLLSNAEIFRGREAAEERARELHAATKGMAGVDRESFETVPIRADDAGAEKVSAA